MGAPRRRSSGPPGSRRSLQSAGEREQLTVLKGRPTSWAETGSLLSSPRPSGTEMPPLPQMLSEMVTGRTGTCCRGVADLAKLKGRARRGGHQDRVHLGIRGVVVLRDERAGLLRGVVILVVHARAQQVAAQHLTALRLGTKAVGAPRASSDRTGWRSPPPGSRSECRRSGQGWRTPRPGR